MNRITTKVQVRKLPCLCRYINISRQTAAKLKTSDIFSEDGKHDWIGPPHKDSNIRIVKIHKPETETALQKELRLLREDTQKFNHEFWTKHNSAFFQQKELFVKRTLAQKKMNMNNCEEKDNEDVPTSLTAEEMSVFYKKFLNENYQKNLLYNGEWYRRNFSIYVLTNKVKMEKLKLRLLKFFNIKKNKG